MRGVSTRRGVSEKRVTFRTATNIARASRRDDQDFVFDAQGLLWRVPPSGGDATRLTSWEMEASRPDLSSTGIIACQSYLGCNFHIWTLDMDCQAPAQCWSVPRSSKTVTGLSTAAQRWVDL